jgi:hypothetical protein
MTTPLETFELSFALMSIIAMFVMLSLYIIYFFTSLTFIFIHVIMHILDMDLCLYTLFITL